MGWSKRFGVRTLWEGHKFEGECVLGRDHLLDRVKIGRVRNPSEREHRPVRSNRLPSERTHLIESAGLGKHLPLSGSTDEAFPKRSAFAVNREAVDQPGA